MSANNDPVEAAKAELNPPPPEHELMEQAVAAVAPDTSAKELPAQLNVDGKAWTYLAELEVYVDDDGEELDMSRPAARRALLAWKRQRAEVRTLEAAAAEREAAGPDDLHVFHVEHPSEMADFEGGRRWCGVADLAPGAQGSEGVQAGHGVVLHYIDAEGEKYQLQYRVLHVLGETVSLEPGSKIRGDGVVFYPKPHHRAWLEHVAKAEGMTVERWVRRLCAQQYAISDLRSVATASGYSGPASGSSVMADLEAGRRARAASS